MNDAELQARLKSSRPPQRSAEERDGFTGRVMSRLHRNRAIEPEPRRSWVAPFVWGTGVAFAAVLVGFFIGRMDPALPAALRDTEHRWRASIVDQAQQLGLMMDSENAAPGVATDAK